MFGNGDELIWRDKFPVALTPSQQSLEPDQSMAAEVQLGLIDKEQLLVLNGFSQFRSQQCSSSSFRPHQICVLEFLTSVVSLGTFEGNGGILDQVSSCSWLLWQKHIPTGERDLVRNAINVQWVPDALQQLSRLYVSYRSEDAEGIRPETGQQHTRRQRRFKAAGDLFQKPVTEPVTHHVVRSAEVVDVDQRQNVAVRSMPCALVDLVNKVRAIGKVDQWVVVCTLM